MRWNITGAAAIMVALALLALRGAHQPASAAGGCEYPLFIQEGAVDANVLFIFDNSGSMNEAIWHDDYDPSVKYPGGLDSDRMYYVSNDGWYDPDDFDSDLASSPDAFLVNSDHGKSGRYIGNYLNWVFYNATPEQRAAIPVVTRIQVAKPAVISLIGSNPSIRFGIMTFEYDHGPSGPLSPLGTDPATLTSDINSIAGDSWTPIAETMMSAYKYFSDTGNDAIQYECQKTFLVVVTDGLPTKDRDVHIGDQDGDGNDPGSCASLGAPYSESNDCSDWMDDVAWYLRHTDVSDLPGEQNVYTYTIGFNVDARILQETADNGDGLYINVNNPLELVHGLEGVLRDIVNRISSGSAVAVVSTEGNTQDLLFRGKFKPNLWYGYLEAFELPYDPADAPAWEAGQLLSGRSAGSRQIYSTHNGSQIDFTDAYASTLRDSLGAVDDVEAANLINWVRGEDIPGFRDRQGWKLGDVIDSSPMVVGPPAGFFLYDDYLTWRHANANRDRVIYIGANDGMLHCFAEQDGSELWAWIPESLHGRLAELADTSYCHQFYCNLTPKVFDAYLSGQWITMLIAGQKQGGDAYTALDVTDPNFPSFMWETQIPNVNESWARPEPARVESLNKTVAFFGTGPDEVTGRAYLKAVDLENGNEIYSRLLSDNGGTDLNMATAARSVDLDYDGWTDLLYVGDLEGNLWRLDVRESPWDFSRLFEADGGQSIQAQPILTVDYNDDVFLYFGTGRYVENSDLTDLTQQTFYSVIDKHDGATVRKNDMVDETSSITPVGENDRGWFIDLVQQSGERVVEPDALVAGIVYFTSFVPSTDPCGAGGHSWLYSVNFRNGAGDDGDEDESNDTTDGRVEDLGEGVATKPVVDVVNEEVIVQGSDTRIHVTDAKGRIRLLSVRSWRQRYN